MDSKRFFDGVGFITVAYLLYRFILKGKKPSSKETNHVGLTPSTYNGTWVLVIGLFILGVIAILISLPTHI